MTQYRHTQRGTQTLVATLGAGVIGAPYVAFIAWDSGWGIAAFYSIMWLLFFLVFAKLFSSMTIQIGDGRLEWWFGPRFSEHSVLLPEVEHAQLCRLPGCFSGNLRNPVIGGWSPVLGRLYRLSGRNGVQVIRRDGKRFVLGTDEPEALVAALNEAIEVLQPPKSKRDIPLG